MLAGGMVIAAPSMVPEAAAAGQLFVSAENATFDNFFAGVNVVEIIVKDPNRLDADEAESQPTVKVDEHLLTMAQGADGYWYAYIADTTDVANAAITTADAKRLDFGVPTALGVGPTGNAENKAGTVSVDPAATVYSAAAVIEGAPALSPYNEGQIELLTTEWPFIQTFDFTIETFEVKLEQAGTDEIVILTHDNDDIDDFSSVVADRNAATNNAHVHLTITDQALNIDPTTEDVVLFKVDSDYGVSFKATTAGNIDIYEAFNNSFDDNGALKIDYDAQSTLTNVLVDVANADDLSADKYLVFWETAENSGIFVNTDDNDQSNLKVASGALRGTTATIDYNDSAQSYVVAHNFAEIDMDATSVGDEWNSGEEMTIVLYDQDLNLNTASDEDLTVSGGTLVPSIQIGSPLSISTGATVADGVPTITTINDNNASVAGANPNAFSKIATVDATTLVDGLGLTIDTGIDYADWNTLVAKGGTEYINYHLTALTLDVDSLTVGTAADPDKFATAAGAGDADLTTQDYEDLTMTGTAGVVGDGNVIVTFVVQNILVSNDAAPFYVDFFSFSGTENNAIYRIELEETGDNTATFEGSAEYVMLNQLNVDVAETFEAINPTQDDVDMIVHLDMTDEDSIRVNYLDLGADGVSTQIADQEAAPTHSGSADLDLDSYKIADTVIVTITDQDLNTDSELIDVYITNQTRDLVGDATGLHIADITFDDIKWTDLFETGFNLVETGIDSGIFTGSFQVPETFDNGVDATAAATGTDIEVNYNDFRDGSGNTIEVGDGASISANTGSVAFDRTVYPVPFTTYDVHSTAGAGADVIPEGPVQLHIQITDADYDISAIGEDSINLADNVLSVQVTRGSLASGNLAATTGLILETAPDTGIFEYDLEIASNAIDGSGTFPAASIINQGDIITVTYTDAQDASGNEQTVTDSSSFDLRNGVLQSDKSVYLIGSDMILTLIEPDFDLDNDETESYTRFDRVGQ
jgi:hypothetical protein